LTAPIWRGSSGAGISPALFFWDAAVTEPTEPLAVGDIVQIDPDRHHWAAALVVVTEVREWGVQGYVAVPQQGLAFIRLPTGTFEHTGGRAIWMDRDRTQDEPGAEDGNAR
jgi:hypothetical protein